MLKYMKYEVKGTYKYILSVLVLVLILITGLYASNTQIKEGSFGGGLFMGLSMMIIFGTALVTFLYIVGSFRKELYEDRGFLTFTLPLKGIEIVGAKLIVALMWFFILGMAIATYNLVMALSFTPFELNISELFAEIINSVSIKVVFFIIIKTVFSGVYMLVLIYFSMALGKVTFRNKRIGGLWFIIFLILNGVLSFGQYGLEVIFPYYLDIESFTVGTKEILNSGYNFVFGSGGFPGQGIGMFNVNIISSIYSIITVVGLFLGTGYLIEKKIDL
ncbi:MAG TPA: hypothetical protein GXX18_01060 [Bacillales bacterium]|nr:hypothetical protein [Bacillales bacterium]